MDRDPSLSLGVCSNSCPLSQWWHTIISSSVTPISSCPQSFPASGSFLVSWLFTSSDRSTGASASVLPMKIQNWSPLGLIGLISLLSKGLSYVSLHSFKSFHLEQSLPTFYSWSEMKAVQLCPTLCNAMDYTAHRILQARILEWVAFPFSRALVLVFLKSPGQFCKSSRILAWLMLSSHCSLPCP